MKKGTRIFCWGWCALLPLSLGLAALAKRFPDATEVYYSRGFYPVWAGAVSGLTSRLPFSLAEVLVIGAALGAFCYLGFFLRALAKGKGCRLAIAGRYLLRALAAASAVLLLFFLGGGLNYYRNSFTYYSGLELRPSETAQLRALCSELAAQADTLRAGLPEDGDGVFRLEDAPRELAQTASESYRRLMEQNPQWVGLFDLSATTLVKPVFFSEAMSYMQIVGVFFPFTTEANINIHTSDCDIPDAACHELAHISGFMREDEANFLAYLACRASSSQAFGYSGTLSALIHSTNALYGRDFEGYTQVMSGLSPEVLRDLREQRAYYDAHNSRFGDFSTQVNDVFLKVNSQSDGVASYGRMVDLLLADYRVRNGLS